MNSKTKIDVYKKDIEEVCEKFEGALEFINHKVDELCFQEAISTEEVRLYIFKIKRLETYSVLEYLFLCFVMLRTQFSYVHSLKWIHFYYLSSIKIVLF